MYKYLLVLSTMLMALPSFADLTSNVGFSTEYTFRGEKLSDKDILLSAGLDYQGPMGFYAGTWGYTGSIENLDTSQLNSYGGFAFSLGQVSVGLGAILYAPSEQSNVAEYNINLAWDAYRLSTYQDDEDTYQYHELEANYDIWGGNGFSFNIGTLDNKVTKDDTLNYGMAWLLAMEGKVDLEMRVMRNEDTGNVFTVGVSRQIDW